MKGIKIKDIDRKRIYPNGQWVYIAREKDYKEDIDDDVYYYVDNDFDLDGIKIGDTIMLDEEFKVIDVMVDE